jgi:hypothetical protein
METVFGRMTDQYIMGECSPEALVEWICKTCKRRNIFFVENLSKVEIKGDRRESCVCKNCGSEYSVEFRSSHKGLSREDYDWIASWLGLEYVEYRKTYKKKGEIVTFCTEDYFLEKHIFSERFLVECINKLHKESFSILFSSSEAKRKVVIVNSSLAFIGRDINLYPSIHKALIQYVLWMSNSRCLK